MPRVGLSSMDSYLKRICSKGREGLYDNDPSVPKRHGSRNTQFAISCHLLGLILGHMDLVGVIDDPPMSTAGKRGTHVEGKPRGARYRIHLNLKPRVLFVHDVPWC